VAGVSYADRDSEEDDAEMEEIDKAAPARPVRATPRKKVEEEEEEGSAELEDDAADGDGDEDRDGREEQTNEPGEEEEADPAPSSPMSARPKGMASRNRVKGNGIISEMSAFAALDGKAGGVAKAGKGGKAAAKVTPLKKNNPTGNANPTVRETRRTRA
jgi:hypothetical protein